MQLPILGQNGDPSKAGKDFRNCAGCALVTICHPGVVIEADGAPVDESKRCADFVPGEAPIVKGSALENDGLH